MKIAITSPIEGESLPYRRRVSGVVFPALSQVQVFIYSGDNFWYRQADPLIMGSSWEIDNCYFGNENSYGASFKIIALDGSARLDNKISRLPTKGSRSNIVAVSRLPTSNVTT